MKKRHLWLSAALLFAITGCSGDGEVTESDLALLKTTNPPPTLIDKNTKKNLDLVASIEHDVESMEELYDVAVVKGDGDTLVAYKVKHLKRFNMKKIEKKMNKMLEEKYPDENFTVSSDYKIFIEAVELQEKMKDPDFSDKKAKKKLDKIIKLKNEMT
ncbi:YhcN/YlaJ family sporulation lipoprotein [Bacillus sp. ISL-47]|uniref:YhcN/YlaJ family sporulation lipoprotein n=1 Tax=Bacillus sp. ISL-47 TaxID=2819130 RepID=UPI001BE5DAF9|nr:YhcN/YlaJ family sporulation lipoprotein [Bacillus sp. ISL-47]MBT2688313.1 YhcN/YlaJ family sporulation lipoprotein [Bacillus sp. ISL-47]MBT2710106.1 YhcN/YlaJ family sporulation lipoprotein [Pseudomonas sp. ISL-84]